MEKKRRIGVVEEEEKEDRGHVVDEGVGGVKVAQGTGSRDMSGGEEEETAVL